MSSKRTFDDVLTEVGEFGRFQKLLLILLLVPNMFSAVNKLAWAFLGAEPDHRCRLPDEINQTIVQFHRQDELNGENCNFHRIDKVINSIYSYFLRLRQQRLDLRHFDLRLQRRRRIRFGLRTSPFKSHDSVVVHVGPLFGFVPLRRLERSRGA